MASWGRISEADKGAVWERASASDAGSSLLRADSAAWGIGSQEGSVFTRGADPIKDAMEGPASVIAFGDSMAEDGTSDVTDTAQDELSFASAWTGRAAQKLKKGIKDGEKAKQWALDGESLGSAAEAGASAPKGAAATSKAKAVTWPEEGTAPASAQAKAQSAIQANALAAEAGAEGAISGQAAASGGTGGALPAVAIGLAVTLSLAFAATALIVLIAAISVISSSTQAGDGMFFWWEFEAGAGKSDQEIVDTVTFNDGAGGQAYGPGLDYRYGLPSFLQWACERDPETFAALAPFRDGVHRASSHADPLPAAWHATCAAHGDAMVQAVKDYSVEHYYKPNEASLERNGYMMSARSDVCKGAILSWVWQNGSIRYSDLAAAEITDADDDESFLIKLYAQRTALYGGLVGGALADRYERELAKALMVLHVAQQAGGPVVARAQEQIGRVTYTWGGCSPGAMDCSGFVSYCLTGQYRRLGTTYTFLTWPRTDSPVPGDVCTNEKHCGIYIGNGQMIDCGLSGVRVRDVPASMVYVKYPG